MIVFVFICTDEQMRILSSFVSSSTSGQTVLIRLPFNVFIIIIFLVVFVENNNCDDYV